MEIINTIKNYHWLVTVVGGVFIAIISTTWLLSAKYNDFNKETEELLKTVKTTQQMALKSVIWNDEIPLTERASACDVYLAAGYNSLTKKECEIIIENASETGVFSFRNEGNIYVQTSNGSHWNNASQYLSRRFISAN